MCKIVHAVPGADELWNGISVASKLIVEEQNATIIDVKNISSSIIKESEVVWVHSMWTPQVWRACWLAVKGGKPIVRMIHGCVDPVRLNYHGWKKWLVGPIERFLLRRCERIIATCEAEKGWIGAYLGQRCPKIEVTDVKRFFSLGDRSQELGVSDGFSRKERKNRKENDGNGSKQETGNKKLNLLYLGRRHPLKGVEYLEQAVKGIKGIELRIVSNAFGEEKEKVWDWCDVLVLPTLSENFGLVVAEALERGKRVITTDGAPVWGEGLNRVDRVERVENGEILFGYEGRLLYLNGYRDGMKEKRVELLKKAIEGLGGSR